ncbi:uncharacterized protein LOC119171278 isoform X2 [Rhipicephalus microplus]|uniref:uncharacterized protein LOC119171278 isoform X2 n=1 Tax=Rhipicephalus microplus TaxID=6941 RepID=UPI003F6D6331
MICDTTRKESRSQKTENDKEEAQRMTGCYWLKDLTRDFAPICLLGGLPALKMNLTGFLVAYCQAPGKITSANTENVFMLTM